MRGQESGLSNGGKMAVWKIHVVAAKGSRESSMSLRALSNGVILIQQEKKSVYVCGVHSRLKEASVKTSTLLSHFRS